MSTESAAAATPEKVEQPAAPRAPETPLSKLTARLADITKQVGHTEMWGVELSDDASHIPSQVVLQKFLRANPDDLAAAEKQLTAALEWRKKVQPTTLVSQAFDEKKFGGLGFVTTHKNEAGKETVITWNIYGSVKDNKATFGNVDEFIKWRAALMELSVQHLHLNDAKELIPENGIDQYQMLQVHDYQSVSFFRMDPHVKAASKETISVFSTAYPELLAHKYFVNVPAIMGWMFGAMKLFLAPATLKKFHPMTSGTTLSTELKDISSSLPKEYGGKGPSVQEGKTIALATAAEVPKESPTDDVPVKSDEEEVPVEVKKEDAPKEEDGKKEEAPAEVKKEEALPTELSTTEIPIRTKEDIPVDTKPAEETPAVVEPETKQPEVAPAEEKAPVDESKAETTVEASDAAPKEPEVQEKAPEAAPKEPEATVEAPSGEKAA